MSKSTKKGRNARSKTGSFQMTAARRAHYDRLSASMKGNTRALTTGVNSKAVRSGALLDAASLNARRQQAEAIVDELGGQAQVSTLKASLITRYLELEHLADYLIGHVLVDGVLTQTGKTRSAVLTFLSVADRLARLAGQIGIERKPKPVGDLETFLAARSTAPVLPAPSTNDEDEED